MSNWQRDEEDWINEHEAELAYEFATQKQPEEFFAYCQDKYRDSKMWDTPWEEPPIEEIEEVLTEVLDDTTDKNSS